MTPILYEPNATAFTNNGIGLLTDALTCYVSEELNGAFELEMAYPVHGIHFLSTVLDGIIKAAPEEQATTLEPFRIYHISEPINGVVTINARHSTYMLNFVPVMPIASAERTAAEALAAIKAAAAEACPVNFTTDITTRATFERKEPQGMRSVLGGIEGSFLDVYGGEFKWSWPNVQVLKARGEDRGFAIDYGKNLVGFLRDSTTDGIITGICPYVRNTAEGGAETILTLPEKVIESQYASLFPFRRTVCVDLSDKFTGNNGAVTEEQLRTEAQKYVNSNAVGVPRISTDISFVETKDGRDYAIDYANTVHLGDTVTVNFPMYNLSIKEKVVKTVYNVLKDRYESVTIGKPMDSLASTIYDISNGTFNSY